MFKFLSNLFSKELLFNLFSKKFFSNLFSKKFLSNKTEILYKSIIIQNDMIENIYPEMKLLQRYLISVEEICGYFQVSSKVVYMLYSKYHPIFFV
jgi:hypothetical protein